MPNYKPRAKKPLTAVWLVSVKESDPITPEEFVWPEITVAVDWQADPKVIERDFAVIVSKIRQARRADLERMNDLQVAEAACKMRRPFVRRLVKLAKDQGEADPLRLMEAGQGADWPSARTVAAAIGRTPDQAKRPLRRTRTAFYRLVLKASRRRRRSSARD